VTNIPLAASLTPVGRGAVAVIAVHGEIAHRAILRCFQPATPLPPTVGDSPLLPLRQIRYGQWQSPLAERAAESVVVFATAADYAEVHCHGGQAAVAAILNDLKAVGVPSKSAAEFTAVVTAEHGVNAEHGAEAGPIGSPPDQWFFRNLAEQTNTAWTCGLALAQLRGAMSQWATQLIAVLADDSQTVNDREQLAQLAIAQLRARQPAGRHLVDPWRIVVAGPPNVGKSTLLNTLLGYQRAITFDQPGTTRDLVSADTAIKGWPVRLVDTAGLRVSDDPLEAEGVRRATRQLQTADLVLAMTDARQGLTEMHAAICRETTAPLVVVHNKIDLLSAAPPAVDDLPTVGIVAREAGKVEPLLQLIEQSLIPGELRQRTATPAELDDASSLPPIPLTPRQCSLLADAAAADSLPALIATLRELG
jgi:tRNA modification GTPase